MGAPSNFQESFVPSIAGFFCQKCGQDCLAKYGESGEALPATMKSVRIICAEKVGPDMIKEAFNYGADGVLICGCLVGHCDTRDGNPNVLAHIHQSKQVLRELGLASGRLRQDWICSPEVDNIPNIIAEFAGQLRELGPVRTGETAGSEKQA
jgi:F420-non-reducing hydrogenase iron-sulfur subunit